jgi:ATP-dependent Lhr-like helicase
MSSDVFNSIPFHPVIVQWFQQHFAAPSPPQKQGWPSIAGGKHTLILAPTGSGKTLAAFLWSIDQLFCRFIAQDTGRPPVIFRGVHTLYISPLKALNNDIYQNLTTPLKQIRRLAEQKGLPPVPIQVAVRTGDTPSHVRRSMLRNPPDILITTPESLYLLLTSAKGRELFRHLKYVIVDEIHSISNNKRGVHLSLSLERLMPLCEKEPLRIGLSATQKPLRRIAAFLGGQKFCESAQRFIPREVTSIDCGQRKNLDLKVITPVRSFQELPDSSVWEPVYLLLYNLICRHRTTLVFANMRAQTEKIARQLNDIHRQVTGKDRDEVALAHHGSISREARYEIEARLKAGKIPAVIATASLELGIDIGSIDLVVQLEAPRTISGALQRVGRSGHLMAATRKGRIIVLYPADLDDALTIADCMQRADIEETVVVENALDVLAQQIVAEVAGKDWPYDALFTLVRQSYCYRNLPPALFKSVIEMLDGNFASTPLQVLKARLRWDRVNNRLIAQRGSRLSALLNAGTIPDRGYFGVYLKNSNVKLGEMEEEFVFESRVGEVFFLGNSEWRIDSIDQSRIIVTPVAAIKPKAPFWKGDILFRDHATSKKVGRFRRRLLDKLDRGEAQSWLVSNYCADTDTAENLVSYFQRQREQLPAVPTDRQLVVETSVNADGIPLLVLHAPLGARVNGAWALALAAVIEQHYGMQAQYSFDDDGVLIRLPDGEPLPPVEEIFKRTPAEFEAHLIAALPDSPIFAVQFRYIAARALVLPRTQAKKRIPLYLQRLRAADLMQAIEAYRDFPLIVETYRDCLQDKLDLAALKKVLRDVNAGKIRLTFATTRYPSPMAANVLYKFVASYLYETDQHRRPGQKPGQKKDRQPGFLSEILEQEKIPAVLTEKLIREAQKRWQYLAAEYRAASAEELFTIIDRLGPISGPELAKRSKQDPCGWLAELQSAGRIVESRSARDKPTRRLWQICEQTAGPSDIVEAPEAFKPNALKMVQRYLSSRGPVEATQVQKDLDLPRGEINKTLQQLKKERQVVCGKLVKGAARQQWCDRYNFMQLYRSAIAERRKVAAPAGRQLFIRFLMRWHGIASPGQPLRELIERYRGFRFPLHFFEGNVLSSRYGLFDRTVLEEKIAEFEGMIADGRVIAQVGKNKEGGRRTVEFHLRSEGNLFTHPENLLTQTAHLNSTARAVYGFLEQNGASYFQDIELGTGLSPLQLQRALQVLADCRLVSCENYPALLMIVQTPLQQAGAKSPPDQYSGPSVAQKPGPKPHRSALRQMVRGRLQLKDGRWFLTLSFASMGPALDEPQRALRQARLLLQRYGILVKEWYRREQGLLPWHKIFQALKRLEWQGEIRRGYFVDGLSGVQFAMPAAVDLLERLHHENSTAAAEWVMLSTIDPAMPLDAAAWQLLDHGGNPLKIARSTSNHLIFENADPVLYAENDFEQVVVLKKISAAQCEKFAKLLHNLLKLPQPLRSKNHLVINRINNRPAATSLFAAYFIKAGYERDGERLVLWPSRI